MNILIIGASSGLGMNICNFYSKNFDANIICTSSDFNELKLVKKNIYSRFRKKIKISKCDLLIDSDILKLINFTKLSFKKNIDLIYYCSGVNLIGKTLEENLINFEDMLKINFIGFHYLITNLYKNINNNYKSQIIFISSISTIRVRLKNFLYSTSKKIVEFYVNGLNIHLNKSNINILIVNMGFLDTKLGVHVNSFLKINPYDACNHIHKNLLTKKDSIFIPSYWYILRILILIIPKKIWNAFKV